MPTALDVVARNVVGAVVTGLVLWLLFCKLGRMPVHQERQVAVPLLGAMLTSKIVHQLVSNASISPLLTGLLTAGSVVALLLAVERGFIRDVGELKQFRVASVVWVLMILGATGEQTMALHLCRGHCAVGSRVAIAVCAAIAGIGCAVAGTWLSKVRVSSRGAGWIRTAGFAGVAGAFGVLLGVSGAFPFS